MPDTYHAPDEYYIDLFKLGKNRLPDYLNKKYILSKLNIQGLREPIKSLSIGCDAHYINIIFANEKIISIEGSVDSGADFLHAKNHR